MRVSNLLRLSAAASLVCVFATGPAWASNVCGDGVPAGGEECDPGGALYVNGDPALGSCTTGENCYYANSCCKFNCQYVGSGNVCSDGDACTGPDQCNQTGLCIGQANSPNGTPCDDGLFCNGTESCTNGICGSSSGNPCPGTECNTCQENTDTCFDPNGASCNGGSGCVTGQCNGAGACVGVPNSNPCDDGLYCNGADTCAGGTCSVHAGDPCPGGAECANVCNEAADNCNLAAGTPCTDDGNACTDNTCDGAGTCAVTNNAAACDDGVFCNGTDNCSGGSCLQHGGDPCADGVSCTDDSCDEVANTCSNTAQNAQCDDGLYCNGVETCDPQSDCQAGTSPCDDGNSCTVDNCVEADDSCGNNPLPELAACDDGSKCTIEDQCTGGICVGHDPLLADLCPWTVVVREDPKGDRMKSFMEAQVEGDICASQLIVGASSFNDGDLVAVKTSGKTALKVGLAAQMTGDIVSGGGGAKGRPTGVNLPYTADLEILNAGSVTAKNDASGVYDLSGTHPLVAACTAARQAYADAASDIALRASDLDAGQIRLRSGESATIVAPNPGAVNVIDVSELRGNSDVTITIDGGGDAGTVVVLRVAGRFQLRNDCSINLIGGLTPDHLLIYVAGHKCDVGNHSQGAGTLLCPDARIRVDYDTLWTGAWFAGRRLVRIGERIVLTHAPFQGL